MTAKTFLVGGGSAIAVAALYLDQRAIREDPRSGAVTVVTYLVREGKALPEIPDRGDDDPENR